jgi:hypothetical protein
MVKIAAVGGRVWNCSSGLTLARLTRRRRCLYGSSRCPFLNLIPRSDSEDKLRAEARQFLDNLEWLLAGEAIKQPHESDLVGKAKPVVRAPALNDLHLIFTGETSGVLELLAVEHRLRSFR